MLSFAVVSTYCKSTHVMFSGIVNSEELEVTIGRIDWHYGPLLVQLTSLSMCILQIRGRYLNKYNQITRWVQNQTDAMRIYSIWSLIRSSSRPNRGGEITKIPVQSICRRLGHTFNWRWGRLGNYNCTTTRGESSFIVQKKKYGSAQKNWFSSVVWDVVHQICVANVAPDPENWQHLRPQVTGNRIK